MTTDLRRGSTHVDLDEVPPRELLLVQRLARELRLTDQILSLDLDSVSVVQSGPAPAWTTLEGDKVSFAYNRMPAPRARLDIAVWLGTNAHELGHVLFSPRKGSTLMYRVIESDRAYLPGMAMIHNIVEDQRQERLLLARFAPWAGYLTAALGHHLAADEDSAWLLMCGRSWLPSGVRAAAKARMIATRGQRDTDEVTRIVGEYQRLTDPGDTESDEAWELLQELYRLFEDDMPKNLGTTCTVMTGGEPDTGEPGGSAPDTADEADADSDDADGDGDGDGGSRPGDDGDGDGGGKNDTPKPESKSESGGGGAGNQPSKPLDQSDVKKALKNAARQMIEKDDETRDDLDQIVDAIEYGRPGDKADGDDPIGRYDDATDAARLLHHEVGDALLDLKDEVEPGWNKRVESGRLNVRRLLNPNTEPDEMFDRYEPGMMDSSELEVVLLLDVSGSMANKCFELGEATWAIRHAVDDLEGRITVITYDSGPHRILAEPGTRPDDRMFIPASMGGTVPKSAIREAYRLLDGADAKNRLLVILTDGDWALARECDDLLVEMGKSGITTVMALLPTGYGLRFDPHGCQHAATINEPADLARLFRKVAAERITSWR